MHPLAKILSLLSDQYFKAKKLGGDVGMDYFLGGASKGFDRLPRNLANLPAHGMAKGGATSQTEALLDLLKSGTNPTKNSGILYSAPLRGSREAASAVGTGGSAYREGAFQLIGRQGSELRDKLDDLIGIGINPAYPEEARKLLIELIGGIRPGLKVGTYDELPEFLADNPLNRFVMKPRKFYRMKQRG